MDHETLPVDTAVQNVSVVTQDETQNAPPDKAIAITSVAEEAVIAELKPTSYDKILVARVYRKWIAVTYQKNGKKN